MSNSEKIQIKIHPRAFISFGEELVTNDTVALTELVKNSYDAFAETVKVSFGFDDKKEPFIKIQDDGCGMTRDTILNAWAMLATPYKKHNPIIKKTINDKEMIRVVSGNKGLGRFSAARLGEELYMYTKNYKDIPLHAFFDWTTFDNVDNLSDCNMTISPIDDQKNEYVNPGTTILIKKLHSVWDKNKILQLKNDLGRLISPFDEVSDFKITLISDNEKESVDVTPHKFINNPVYSIKGSVASNGNITWNYTFHNNTNKRTNNGSISWDLINDHQDLSLNYLCGEFSFEIRAWDLDAESITEVSEQFDIGKRDIRKNISVYKGLSVYRDGILVLPKSETSRDWLGLDAKRISQIGRKISTSQIVGIVNISNQYNPKLKDTTDREKLVDNIEYSQFTDILYAVVNKLENERTKDKVENKKRNSLIDIISPLSSKPLVAKIEDSIKKGKTVDDILQDVKQYDTQNEKQINELNDRLVYYAQTASLGSVAIVIMHEFRTGLTAIKRFLNKALNYKENFDSRTNEYLTDAQNSHSRIMEVTNSFAPLYKKDLKKRKNTANLKIAIDSSVRLIKSKKISDKVQFVYDIDPSINVNINDGELQTLFINLFDNACFWIKDSKNEEQKILISIEKSQQFNKILINVSDTGIGILEEDVEKIFAPGVTSKPYGIGMGLVIISEILSYYDCKIATRVPGDIQGATFIFELPTKG